MIYHTFSFLSKLIGAFYFKLVSYFFPSKQCVGRAPYIRRYDVFYVYLDNQENDVIQYRNAWFLWRFIMTIYKFLPLSNQIKLNHSK